MVEGFAASQSQFKLLKKEQEEVLKNAAEQKQILESYGKSLDHALQRSEAMCLKEVILKSCDVNL